VQGAGSRQRAPAARQISNQLRSLLREYYPAALTTVYQPQLVEDALGKQMLALLIQVQAACAAADNLAKAVDEAFPQHPDAETVLSFPRLDTQLGARVLAGLGDDRQRFADARGLKAYAGASPITRASGKKSSITRR
jgi:transposase